MAFGATPDPEQPSVVRVEGDLDVATAPALLDAGMTVIDRTGALVLELGGLTFLDSSGLAALVRLHKRLADHTGRLVLRALPANARRILDITGLAEVFTIE
jgi:anti-sigma B factor antagonist